jgi:hypothetical protein
MQPLYKLLLLREEFGKSWRHRNPLNRQKLAQDNANRGRKLFLLKAAGSTAILQSPALARRFPLRPDVGRDLPLRPGSYRACIRAGGRPGERSDDAARTGGDYRHQTGTGGRSLET